MFNCLRQVVFTIELNTGGRIIGNKNIFKEFPFERAT